MVAEAKGRVQNLSPEQVADELDKGGVTLVDVREDDERAQSAATSAATLRGAYPHATASLSARFNVPTMSRTRPDDRPAFSLWLCSCCTSPGEIRVSLLPPMVGFR